MADEKYNIDLKVDDNIGDVLKRLDEMTSNLSEIQDGLEEIGTSSTAEALKGIGKMEKQMSKFLDVTLQAAEDSQFGRNFENSARQIGGIAANMRKLRDEFQDYAEAVEENNEELAREKENQYKNTMSLLRREKKEMLMSMEAQSKNLKRIFVEDKKELDKILKEDLPSDLGKGIGSAIQAALSGDIGGVIGGLTEGAGGIARLGAGKARNLAEQRAAKKELATGVPAGKGGMGKAMKSLGGFARFLGPLAVAVGGLGAIVKLLMDSEAQTKELNQALLEQVSYYKMSKAGLGDTNDILADMRESATDFRTNMRLGLEPKQHYEVIAALDEHNADLVALSEEYGDFGTMARSTVESIRVASLNMGTSLQETSAFVATMSDIHGASFGQIQQDLGLLTELASEAGISTKKFFGVVSQISGQMGLYNYKLEDTANLLTQMNKIMDSQNAEEFTTQMTTGIKDMNGQERLRKILLADEVKIQRQLRQVVQDMFVDITKVDDGFVKINKELQALGYEGVTSAQELQARLKELRKTGDYQELMFRVNENAGEKVGRALSMAGKMSADVEAGGLRLADALGNLGAMGNIEMEISILERLFGPIQDIPLIMAESLGYNEKQLKQMQRFSEISRGQTSALMRQFQAFKEGQISEADFEAFAEGMGIGAVIEEGNLVNEKTKQLIKDEYDVQRAMSFEAKDRAKEAAKRQMSDAEKQIAATRKVGDILQALIYDVLNSISGAVEGIYGVVQKIFGEGPTRQETAAQEVRSQEALVRELRRSKLNATSEKEREMYEAQLREAESELAKRKKSYRIEAQIAEGTKAVGNIKGVKGYRSYLEKGGKGTFEEYQKMQASAQAAAASQIADKYKAVGGYKELTYTGKGLTGFERQTKWTEFADQEGRKVTRTEMASEEKALQEKLFQEALNQKLLTEQQNEIQEEFHKTLLEETGDQKSKIEATNKILESKGININSDAAKKFRDAQIEAYEIAQMTERLKSAFGAQAGAVARTIYDTGTYDPTTVAATLDPTSLRPTLNSEQEAALRLEKARAMGQPVPRTNDAKILTSGVAALNFKAGDMVVDSASLARVQRGATGQFVPDVLSAAGGAGSKTNSNFNFNITVNNPQQGDVQKEIVKAYEMIKRKEMGG